MSHPDTPTARHLADAIELSHKTQKEIARDAGFPSSNTLSMMKSGETKVPVDRIPKLAHALGIPPSTFINIALREYHPDLHAVLSDQYGIGLSPTARLILDVLDEAQQAAHITLDAELCDLIVQLLICAGRDRDMDDADF